MTDQATPNLPSRDFDSTAAFYERLGFGIVFRDALADVLIVHDARDFVALADGQQVGRQAHAGRRRLFLNRSSFVWKAVHLDRWAALPGWLGFISHPLALICYAGGSRPASQSRIPVEHRQVRIRDSEEGTPARGWAYFTYPARLTPLDTPRKVYTNPLAKSCISCEKGWIYRKNRYNDPEAGLCSGKALLPCCFVEYLPTGNRQMQEITELRGQARDDAKELLKISITQKIRPVVILFHYGESWNLLRADQRLIFAKSWPRASRYQQGHQDLFILRSDLPSQVFIRRKVRRVMLPTY